MFIIYTEYSLAKILYKVKNISGIELTVIGEGYDTHKKSNKNVKFLGRLSNQKVLEEMRKADIFILPSINETFGMVYLEAMASGCITVCTQNDGIDGIIKDGINGFTVIPDIQNIQNLLIKLKNLDKTEINRIRENSAKTVKQYTLKKCCQEYLNNILSKIYKN